MGRKDFGHKEAKKAKKDAKKMLTTNIEAPPPTRGGYPTG